MSQHYRAPQRNPNLYAYAQQYQQEMRPPAHMRQAAQQGAENIRAQHMEEEEAIRNERRAKLQQLRQKASTGRSSRNFVYSTYKEGNKTYVAFEKPAFVTMILLLSIGIGILAIDARKALHFLGHTIRKSISAMTS